MIKELSPVIEVSKKYGISKPSLVGGIPRDSYLGVRGYSYDYDVTTNNSDSLRLGILFADYANKSFTVFNEGNLKVFLEDTSVDFSSNFKSDRVIEYMKEELSITDPDLFESYSRDFTINTLQQDIETGELTDRTGLAKEDLDSKIIRTVVPPEITLADDPRRVIRAINFAARYDFEIDEGMVRFIRDNLNDLFSESSNIKDSFVISKISNSIKYNSDKTFFYIEKMGILDRIPLEGDFKNELIRRKLVLKYLDR